jgi:LacI family transcriptional regulator
VPLTIEDVAREAGVSTATVSRVMNNHSVREATREKVLKAIGKLKWEPNLLARGLMKGSARTVGVVIPSYTNPYFTEIAESLESTLAEADYLGILCSTEERSENREQDVVETLLRRQVDGIIVVDGSYENNHNGYFTQVSRRVPLVVINGNPDQKDVDLVLTDQAQGMRTVLDYLYELGHRDTAFFMAEREASAEIKWQAFKNWFILKELTIEDNRLVRLDGVNRSRIMVEMEDRTLRWIQGLKNRPTAIFACNDLIALGVINGLDKAGLRVPEDISVVGHDNTPYASLVKPGLTTVEMKMKELGSAAARRVIDLIEDKGTEPQKIYFTPHLVTRESTAPPWREG